MKVFYREEQTAKHNSSFSPSAGKPAQAVASWKRLGLPVEIMDFEPATREQLKKVHDPGYVDDVLDLKRSNGFNNKLPEMATALPYVAGSMVAATLHAFKTGETSFSPRRQAHTMHVSITAAGSAPSIFWHWPPARPMRPARNLSGSSTATCITATARPIS